MDKPSVLYKPSNTCFVKRLIGQGSISGTSRISQLPCNWDEIFSCTDIVQPASTYQNPNGHILVVTHSHWSLTWFNAKSGTTKVLLRSPCCQTTTCLAERESGLLSEKNAWEKSDVVELCTNAPRSHMIRRPNESGVLRRNRRHLRKTNLKWPEYNRPFHTYSRTSRQPTSIPAASTAESIHNPLTSESTVTLSNSSSTSSALTSRYGCPIKFPTKYSDYVV